VICVIPFHRYDKEQAIRLANHIRDMGGVSNHDCLLVYDEGTTSEGVLGPLTEAFRNVSIFVVPDEPDIRWNAQTKDASAPNEMWVSTAWHIYYNQKCPWLWCEVDCCPMYPAWLDDIEADYLKSGKMGMGAKVLASTGERISGIAVYPAKTCDASFKAMQPGNVPWDVVGALDFLKKFHQTTLIHHLCIDRSQLPTFPDQASLSIIPQGTALFHPNKTGDLIERLRERANASRQVNQSIGKSETAATLVLSDHANAEEEYIRSASITETALTIPNAIKYLVEMSAKDGFAKGRICKQLASAGFVVKPPKKRK